jgi:hypothetical protein
LRTGKTPRKLAADPAWPKFLEKADPALLSMENKILRPAVLQVAGTKRTSVN